jgi:hypothetical protein
MPGPGRPIRCRLHVVMGKDSGYERVYVAVRYLDDAGEAPWLE